MGFSQINCLYLRAQMIWAFPTSFSCSDTDKKTEGVQMRLEKPILFARADNMGFSQIDRVFLKKTTLSADNVGFFRKTYFI